MLNHNFALRYMQENADEFEEVKKPVQTLVGDFSLCYIHLRRDGKYFALSDNPEIFKEIYDYDLFQTSFFLRLKSQGVEFGTALLIWPLKEKHSLFEKAIKAGISHGMSLLSTRADGGIDCYNYIFFQESGALAEILINDHKLIKNYSLYLHETMQPLFVPEDDIYFVEFKGVEKKNSPDKFRKIENVSLKKVLDLPKYKIFIRGEEMALSRKKMEVLILMAKGLSVKDMAQALDVSPSNVFKHVKDLKEITHTNDKSALLTIVLQENPLFREFLKEDL